MKVLIDTHVFLWFNGALPMTVIPQGPLRETAAGVGISFCQRP